MCFEARSDNETSFVQWGLFTLSSSLEKVSNVFLTYGVHDNFIKRLGTLYSALFPVSKVC